MAVLLGRYELMRPIAKGGMATVYLARVVGEGGFERLVALKLMHPHIANEPEFVAMFLDEARLAARIRHPNVVPTLAVERSADGLFLVLEYVDGHPLHSVVRARAQTKNAFPMEIALRIIIDALEGLHAAHELCDESGIPLHLVHRDVSPQNVLIGTDGVARITDFGVAHARARLATTRGAGLKGKVAYLSPEQIMSGQVDRRSDLFAAGIVLWEMLTFRRLFRGKSEGETLARIMAGAARAPHEVRPDIPTQVSAVCMKALDSKPDRRFQTALEMVEALESAAAEAGVAIAKPREVGAFLQSLDIAEAPTDAKLPAGSGSSSSSGIANVVATPSLGTLPMDASMTAPTAAAPSRRRWPLAVAGLAVVGVAGAAVIIATTGHAEPPTAATVAAPPVSEQPPPEEPSEPEAPSATATTSAEPEPSTSAPPPPSSAPKVAAPRIPKAFPPPTQGTPHGPKAKAGYRPEDL
jgi:serine/threonine protein kinase